VTLAHLGDPRVEVLDPDEMQFCLVPRAEFWLGSGEEDKMAYDDEEMKGRAQRYKLNYGYWMARYPATNAQFERIVKDKGYGNARYWSEAREAGVWREGQIRFADSPRQGPLDWGTPFGLANHPVVGVTWYEALAYTRWLTERWRWKSTSGRTKRSRCLPSPSGRRRRAGGSRLSAQTPSMPGRGRHEAGCQPSLMSPRTSFYRTSNPNVAIPEVATPTRTEPTMPTRASARPTPSVSFPGGGEPLWLRGDEWQLLGVDAESLGRLPLSRKPAGP
jgi:Sulfatase-modifying factor enzyme 1